ncbi:ExeA family protein [uncultured Amphritea sp.]|uniref:ExeA family protein n=1 Tax=uncultured Amphritea sp. TaxID=981605 RepID=UPI00262C438E|nr:ExeA family protein [uncultured Amphritea sp.]
MYNHYFGLTSSPFAIAPDPGYLYMSAQHRDALAHLLYGIQSNSGFVMLTGEIGTGKTTLCRYMLNNIPEMTDVAFILNPTLSSEEFLASICDELHISYDKQNLSIKLLSDAIYRHLLRSHADGKNTILIIDEAQNLSPTVLEQMRLLTNLETNEKKLLQIVMFGQPELRKMIERPELKQLAQRITARFHLTPLHLHETEHYLNHRLAIAGYKPAAQTPNPIPGNIIKQIHHLSGGVPRLINILCDRALLGAYARNEPAISAKILYQAAREVFGQNPPQPRTYFYRPITVTLGVIFIILLVYRFYPAANDWLSAVASARTTPHLSQTVTPPAEPDSTAANDSLLHSEKLLDTSAPSILAEAAIDKILPSPSPEPDTETEVSTNTVMSQDLAAEIVTPVIETRPTNAITPAPAQLQQIEPADAKATDSGINSERRAYEILFQVWQLQLPDDQDPCLFALNNKLRCLHQQGSWQQLNRNNRPALVRILPKDQPQTRQILLGINSGVATITDGKRSWKTPLSQLDDSDLLNYTLLWHPPEGYHTLTRPGSYGPHILWIKQQLAQLSPLFQSEINDHFDDQLLLYIKAFQRSQNLLQDGIIGPETLIRLNTLTDSNAPSLLSYRER